MNEDFGAGGGAITCPNCGSDNPPASRFCRDCGRSITDQAAAPSSAAPAGPAQPAAAIPDQPPAASSRPPRAALEAAQPAATSAAPPAYAAPVDAQDSRPAVSGSASTPPAGRAPLDLRGRSVLIPAVVGAVVVLALLLFFLVGPGAMLIAPTVKGFATRDVQVASGMGASAPALGRLQRGDPITGKWVNAAGGQARWLRVDWPGAGHGYVWGKDVSTHARPNLEPGGPESGTVAASSVVYAETDPRSPVVDNLAQGEAVTAAGVTSDGWAEVPLNAGGVGYVRVSAFSDDGDANTDASPMQIAALGKITHYTCSYAADQSRSASAGAGGLSFYLDESRNCVNHRYAYFPDDAGGLKRVMLDDRDRRATLLYFMPDRRSFYRTDVVLSPADYGKLLHKSAALETATCAAPADAKAATRLQSVLKRVTPELEAQTSGLSSQRRVWQCTAEPTASSGRMAMR